MKTKGKIIRAMVGVGGKSKREAIFRLIVKEDDKPDSDMAYTAPLASGGSELMVEMLRHNGSRWIHHLLQARVEIETEDDVVTGIRML